MGKCINRLLKTDIQLASGTLQTCAGLESGIEAVIHAMKTTFEKEECKVVMLVDADNAFNRLNRNVALTNIKQICPPVYQYLENSYNTSSKLYLKDGSFILSKEGVTQGDKLAMAKYALGTRGLIDSLASETVEENIVQVWFADDSCCGGKGCQGCQKMVGSLEDDRPQVRIFSEALEDAYNCKAKGRYGYGK